MAKIKEKGKIELHDEEHLNHTFTIVKDNWNSSLYDCIKEIMRNFELFYIEDSSELLNKKLSNLNLSTFLKKMKKIS